MALALAPDVVVADCDGGVVLLDQRNGRHWRLNRTGAATLRLLLDGYSLEAAAARLVRDFPDAAQSAQADVRNLIGTLQQAQLVEAS
jgi:hypothetical protein